MNINNSIEIEVKHFTGLDPAKIEYSVKGSRVSIHSIMSPNGKFDMNQDNSITHKELERIKMACAITPEQFAEIINDSPEPIFNPYPTGSEYHRRFADELLYITKMAGEA